jgi:hypothetical protein
MRNFVNFMVQRDVMMAKPVVVNGSFFKKRRNGAGRARRPVRGADEVIYMVGHGRVTTSQLRWPN